MVNPNNHNITLCQFKIIEIIVIAFWRLPVFNNLGVLKLGNKHEFLTGGKKFGCGIDDDTTVLVDAIRAMLVIGGATKYRDTSIQSIYNLKIIMICPENIGSVCKIEFCLKLGVLGSKGTHRNSLDFPPIVVGHWCPFVCALLSPFVL